MVAVIRRLSANLVAFGLSKSAVLFAPFLAAWALSVEQYGQVEWWLSISMTLGPLIAFGANGVIAYGSLGGTLASYLQLASRYVVLMAILVSSAGIAGFILGKHEFSLISMLSVSVLLQLATAAKLKALGRGGGAALAESVAYIALLVAVLMSLLGLDFKVVLFVLLIISSALMLFNFTCISPAGTWGELRSGGLLSLFRQSYKFVISAVLMALFMASPRLVMGFMSQVESVAAFALIFRWLSISIVIHQFINTIYFKRIYSSVGRSRVVLVAACCGLVATTALIIALILSLDLFGSLGLSALPVPPVKEKLSIWIVALAVVLWSLSACLEGVLNSMGKVTWQITASLLGVVVFMVAVFPMLALSSFSPVRAVSVSWLLAFMVLVGSQVVFIVRGPEADAR
ncbi:hypothetical protein [Pseudomonas urmiensis]|uniref:hypothetical protein n=1 Tax=Pseudomonas urmiensis TaxID=2745493 RepID=UPI0034D41271